MPESGLSPMGDKSENLPLGLLPDQPQFNRGNRGEKHRESAENHCDF
jgi:hypothetical protein